MCAEGLLRFIRFYLLQMSVGVLYRTKFHDHLCGCFFTHAGDPGDVIRTVAHQSLQLNDLPGRHLIFFFYLFRMKIFYCGLPSGRFGKTDHHLVGGQLEKIPVAGKYGYVHTQFLASSCQGSQEIVRLVSC